MSLKDALVGVGQAHGSLGNQVDHLLLTSVSHIPNVPKAGPVGSPAWVMRRWEEVGGGGRRREKVGGEGREVRGEGG